MRRRKHIHRAITVSRIAAARQASHAGKNDPSTSKEGARPQLASRSEAKINPYINEGLLLFLVMAGFPSTFIEANYRLRKPDPSAWLKFGYALKHRLIEPVRGFSGRR